MPQDGQPRQETEGRVESLIWLTVLLAAIVIGVVTVLLVYSSN